MRRKRGGTTGRACGLWLVACGHVPCCHCCLSLARLVLAHLLLIVAPTLLTLCTAVCSPRGYCGTAMCCPSAATTVPVVMRDNGERCVSPMTYTSYFVPGTICMTTAGRSRGSTRAVRQRPWPLQCRGMSLHHHQVGANSEHTTTTPASRVSCQQVPSTE